MLIVVWFGSFSELPRSPGHTSAGDAIRLPENSRNVPLFYGLEH
jgi:hypothetical protein